MGLGGHIGAQKPGSTDPTPLTKYRQLKRLGSGGLAEVFLARPQGDTKRLVVLKRFFPEIVRDEEVLSILFTEAESARKLKHRNVARVVELVRQRSAHVIVSDYAPGRDLEHLVGSLTEPMPLAAATLVAIQIGEALAYAHGEGLLHGNLIPANVRLGNDGVVRLTDFCSGRAAHFLLEGKTRILKRRYGYMSPEQVRGQSATPSSDLFSLGSLLYELLTGENAFQAKNELAILDRVRRGALLRPSSIRADLSQELEDLILRALQGDPDLRWPDAGELTLALRGHLERQAPGYDELSLGAWVENRPRPSHRRSSHPPVLA